MACNFEHLPHTAAWLGSLGSHSRLEEARETLPTPKRTAFLGTVLPIIMSRTTLNYSAAVAVSAAVTVTVTVVVVVVVVNDDDDDDD